MFKDFHRRLQRDIKKLVDARVLASDALGTGEIKAKLVEVNVVSHPIQRSAVWFGGLRQHLIFFQVTMRGGALRSSLRRRRDDDTSCHPPPKRDDGARIPPPKGKLTLASISRVRGREAPPLHMIFECATGYALFLAHGLIDVDMESYQAAEDYINRSDSPFELKAYLPFSSLDDALVQFNAVSNSTVTDKLMNFIEDNFKPPYNRHSLAIGDPMMGGKYARKLGLGHRSSVVIDSAMRGLREKIDKLIALQPGELDKAQRNLARLYNNQERTKMNTQSSVSSSCSFLQEQVMDVVPHRFQGFFNTKGKNNLLCTRNLVPGEALYGEKLIRGVPNDEDRTEVEYRVWDPSRSKLGAAILGGVTNIWIKPGSRVIYVGNVCGLTVSDLSDLVGLDGLVYVVGCSDDVTDMAGKRPNVVTIIEKDNRFYHYRMLLGMVDVIFAEIDHRLKQFSPEGRFIVNHAYHYLRVGGHYMISAQANDMNSSTGHPIFAVGDCLGEFKLLETLILEGGYAMDIGVYRML